MDDIIMSLPESCGERSCQVGWHIRHIWAYADGSYSSCDADGNHYDMDPDDVPSAAEHAAAWLEYSRHVAETGTDPLHEFLVSRVSRRREAWSVRIVNSITGPRVSNIRRGNREIERDNLPAHVVSYLNLDATRRRLQDFATWAELQAAGVVVSRTGWHKFSLDVDVPRRADIVARELKRAARKHIRDAARRATREAA